MSEPHTPQKASASDVPPEAGGFDAPPEAGRFNVPPEAGRFNRERLSVIFFFAVFAFLIYQLFTLLTPFLSPMLGALMLALVVFPLRERFARKWPASPNAVAGLLTLLIVVTVVVPVLVLVALFVREAALMVPAVSAWLTEHQAQGLEGLPESVRGVWASLDAFFTRVQFDVKAATIDAVKNVGNSAAAIGAALVAGFFGVLFQLLILILALFFFLRDGPRMVKSVIDLVPMAEHNKTLVIQNLDRTLVAMVRGSVITAVAQGSLTGVGLALFGVPFAVLLGTLAVFMSVVPFVGAALVWVPGVIYLLITGEVWPAAALAAWGLFAVGLIDNFLRPIVVGGAAQLPTALLFLGVLGGLQVYGVLGGLISPLVIAGVIAFARIYRESYLDAPGIKAP
ncbi:MAG: AI-2E family transporter [Rhodospirillaceae bacterium]|nr:AI-2E family transporter [Rhodospirillaceae bacterium]